MPPYQDTLVLREARDAYLRGNGFSLDGYTAKTFTIKLCGIPLTFPSTQARRRALPLHDLHHILTGYGTDWIGEGEISAWELRAGCNSLFLYWINGSGVLLGILLSPRRVFRAFITARGQRTLYRNSTPYDSLLRMTIGELRNTLGIPPGGLVT